MADPSFRSASTNTDLTGSATSLAIAAPSGLADGDGQTMWVGAFTVSGGNPVLTAPIGWTQVGSSEPFAFGTIEGTLACYRRIASSDGSASFTTDRGAYLVGARLAYQFPHPTSWEGVATVWGGNTASGTSHAASGITTTQNRQLTNWCFVGSTGSTWTSPGTVTERVDVAGGVSFMVSDAIETTAGATGSRTFTSSVTLEGHWGVAAFNGRPDRQPAQVHLQAVKRAGFF